jgi:hypothetical protein
MFLLKLMSDKGQKKKKSFWPNLSSVGEANNNQDIPSSAQTLSTCVSGSVLGKTDKSPC